MKTKPKMRFLYDGIYSLEEQVILEVIGQHDDIEAIDLSERAKHDSDSELEQYLKSLCDEGIPVCALPFHEHSERLDEAIFLVRDVGYMLSHDASFAELSVLGQICGLIGHRPDHYEVVVSAFASNYIKGALEAGATKEELKMIMLRDRRLRGIERYDESGMMDHGNSGVLHDSAEKFIYEWDMDAYIVYDPRQRELQLRCMADLLLLPVYADAPERDVTLMHTTREGRTNKGDGPIIAMDAFFSNSTLADELERSAEKRQYSVSSTYDWVCQLFKVSLTIVQGKTKPVENFNRLFGL